ncbi:MAG: acetoacetate metabolism regulatory protein AtoC [Candidatus Poribacteria bacterium]|nr:MAG: acetoacetate metabolism regulatory protein AtoC [Candidatus Poribacteria bacterium]
MSSRRTMRPTRAEGSRSGRAVPERSSSSKEGTGDVLERSILVVEDEDTLRESLQRILEKEGYSVRVAANGEEGLAEIRKQPPALLLTDLRMPGMDGLDLLRATKMLAPETQVIVMTGHGTVETAVQAMKEGADDFLEKPLSRAVLLPVIEKAMEKHILVTENRFLREEIERDRGLHNVIGQSPKMRRVLDLVRQVAPTTATVLIRGETGTGKEVIAKAIHQLSPRRDRPFISVNCAALPDTLIESELFGYEKGAFTDAKSRRIGRFQQAHTGTLFLDEIGDMQPHVQVKLLRALQEGVIEPLGSERSVPVDVRVIAATNQDLERAVREGRFREELYYRLNVVQIELPPVRERREDIPLLVQHFIRKYSQRHARTVVGIERAAMRALQNYSWPGNVRQLENVVERAVILSSREVITLEDLPAEIAEHESNGPVTITFPIGLTFEEIKTRVIRETLRQTEGNKELAAKILGISSRTIYRWLKEHPEADPRAAPEEDTLPV